MTAIRVTLGLLPRRTLAVEREHGQERLLRHLDRADDLHALLALLLLLEQLALARDVAAVALREHVLALGLDGLAGDDAGADRGLDRHVEELARDDAAQAVDEPLPRSVRAVAVHDEAERIDRIAVEQDVELDEIRGAKAGQFVVERGVAARAALELVVEVEHD